MLKNKFKLKCDKCKHVINDFAEWFAIKQKCPACGSVQASVHYATDMQRVLDLVRQPSFSPSSLWGYFDFLPLNDRINIISNGNEGIAPFDRWRFAEEYAQKTFGIKIKVWAHRNDRNSATGTFKDLAGTMAASVLKESGIKNYVAASTGNIGTAFSRYLAAARINLYVFIPITSTPAQEAEISSFGQNVMRVDGDYHRAKELASEFANANDFVLTGGNFDPMRIEAKKTMVYEWLRCLPENPTVFMQAISGGSGPIGIAKACKELKDTNAFSKMPRFILPQPHRCAPMAQAWEEAKANNFAEGWENNYPVIENPLTEIPTLSTGNPTAYPALSQFVKQSNGEIISCNEDKAIDVARLVAYETTVRIGPAAAITVTGFFDSLKKGLIKDGDVVMLNLGEGVARAPEFVQKMSYTTQHVKNLADCIIKERTAFRSQLWEAIEK